MAYRYNDLNALESDISSAASSNRVARWNAAMAEWRLGEMVDLSRSTLSEEDINRGWFEYQPQTRQYISGDPTPATCESDPQAVDTRSGDPISVRIHAWEKKYDICHISKKSSSLSDDVAEGEFAVGMSMGSMLFNEFWYGLPGVGTYGLFTHPLGVTSVSANGESLSPLFSTKTANEVIGEIRDAMKGMRNPNLAISESAWNSVADKILGTGDNCNRAGDCILRKVVQSESTGNFSGTLRTDFFVQKWLDDIVLPDGSDLNGVYIVWDDDAIDFPISAPGFLSPIQNKKRVDVIRQVSSAGMVVKYTDSLKIVTGIHENA